MAEDTKELKEEFLSKIEALILDNENKELIADWWIAKMDLQSKELAEEVIKSLEYDILNNKHPLWEIFKVTRAKYLK